MASKSVDFPLLANFGSDYRFGKIQRKKMNIFVYGDNRLGSFCLLKACLILEQVPTVRYTHIRLVCKSFDIKSIGQVLSLKGCQAGSQNLCLRIFLCSKPSSIPSSFSSCCSKFLLLVYTVDVVSL